jgi:type II secretory pathway pseudopilin PulG
MTTPPYPSPQQPQAPVTHVVMTPPQNGLGIAGFVTSLVGMLTCGVLSPVGLILSLIALVKPPRGFAIAGTIIGIVGSIWVVLAGFAMVAAALGIRTAAKAVEDYVTAYQSARQAYVQIDQQRTRSGQAPTSADADAVAAKFTDPWGTAYRGEVSDGFIVIRSAGRDKKFDTNDDLRFTEQELQAGVPPTTNESSPRSSRPRNR